MSAEAAWHRSLERLRAGAPLEDDLDHAIAGVLSQGDGAGLPADGTRLLVGSQSIGNAEALPDDVLIGWAGEADGYDRLIVDLPGGWVPAAP